MFWRSFNYFAWIVVAFILSPLVIIIGASFTTTRYVTFPPQGFTLQWYYQLLERNEFVVSFFNSVVIAIACCVVATVIGVLAALALHNYPFRHGNALRTFIMSPLVLPTIVTGVALLQAFYAVGFITTFVGLLVGHVIITIPYVVRTVGAGLSGLDPAMAEAAENLGGSRSGVLLEIIIPSIAPSMMSAMIFVFITSFDQVTVSIFLSGPDLVPLPVRIYHYIDFSLDPMIAAVSTLLICFAFVLVILMQMVFGLDKAFGIKK